MRAVAYAIEAGLITEEEARAALEAASGDARGSGMRERSSAPSGWARASRIAGERAVERRAADLDHVRRLQAGAERVCQCTKNGGSDRGGCGGLCSMAERHADRYGRRPLPPALERAAQRWARQIEQERREALAEPKRPARRTPWIIDLLKENPHE